MDLSWETLLCRQVELEKIQIFCEEFETMKEELEAVAETKSRSLLTSTTTR